MWTTTSIYSERETENVRLTNSTLSQIADMKFTSDKYLSANYIEFEV